MFEAIFVNRSVQYHKDMNYHVMDDDSNYTAKSIDLLVGTMASDGALFEESDDRFSVILLENRVIVGVGILINKNKFRIILKDGTIQDYKLSGNE